jgi:hypothetical protein
MSDEEAPPKGRLPSVEEMRAAVSAVRSSPNDIQAGYERRFEASSITAETEYTHLRGLRDHYAQKRIWSWAIMLLMTFMIGFQSWVVWKVGIGVWHFANYKWLLPALLVQNLAQIIALALVVVKSLFS